MPFRLDLIVYRFFSGLYNCANEMSMCEQVCTKSERAKFFEGGLGKTLVGI